MCCTEATRWYKPCWLRKVGKKCFSKGGKWVMLGLSAINREFIHTILLIPAKGKREELCWNMELRSGSKSLILWFYILKFFGAVSIVWVDSVSREVSEQESWEIKFLGVLQCSDFYRWVLLEVLCRKGELL